MFKFSPYTLCTRSVVLSAAQWDEWLSWGDCSESCGKGIQTRTRSCTKQDRSVVDEAMCDGNAVDTRDCVCETNFSAAGRNVSWNSVPLISEQKQLILTGTTLTNILYFK